MIITDKVHALLEQLRGTAAAKHTAIRVHAPISGAFFTLHDTTTDTPIGRYDTPQALHDALDTLPADPAHPDREAARIARESAHLATLYADGAQWDCDPA